MGFEKLIYKAGIIVSSGYALFRMRHWLLGYTYFTQISNIFIVFVVACQILCTIAHKREAEWLHDLKYLAVLSLFVTLLVFFAASVYTDSSRIIAMYEKDDYSSLCMHFISPILSMLDFFRNDSRRPYSGSIVIKSFLPFAVYMVFIILLGKAGIRWGADKRMAPYPFLNYRGAAGWLGNPISSGSFSLRGTGGAFVLLGAIAAIFIISLLQWHLAGIMYKSSVGHY